MQSLGAHLCTLNQDQLTGLVEARLDAVAEPAPKTASDLAARLLEPTSMAAACALLTLPQLQAGEAAAALGDACTTERLAALLGVSDDDPDLAEALHRLVGLALLWPSGGGLAAAHLSVLWPRPLQLGPSAAELLVARTLNELRGLARLYGIPANGRGKNEVIAALTAWLAQPENVRRLAAQAPDDVRARLADLASRPVSPFGVHGIIYGSPSEPLPWAAGRGLVHAALGRNEMPREVALALRKDYVAPFDPRPPAMATIPATPEAVEQEAAAAASETLAAVVAVAGVLNSGPVPLLKTGGLGVRELRRIAKAADREEDRTRLTIELITAGGLTETSDAGLASSVVYDEFAAADPADQLLEIIDSWLTMPACPLAPAGPIANSARVLYWDEVEEMTLTGLRALILEVLVDAVPEGQAADLGALTTRLTWQSPVLTEQADEDLERFVAGIWREAHQLGLLGHATATRLCRSLLTGNADAAYEQAVAMLPRPRDTVLLQNDLTAVVTGAPSAGLLSLLDSTAVPESRSGAWTWQFSSASIRSALDAGYSPADLLARIAAAAEGGRVPQTLTYLIGDVGRRHGQVQVRPAGCCLSSDDEALLTEILNTRSLQALNLVRIAPTVLVSAKPQAETLAALRAAGHAPAGLQADGGPAIEVRQRPHAVRSAAGRDEMLPSPRRGDPAKVVRTLLGPR